MSKYTATGEMTWTMTRCEIECPHAELCPHKREPPSMKEGEWTSIHTCFTCMEKVLDLWDPDYEGHRFLVPDECPAWDPLSGSATDCGACRAERDQLKQAHPRYAAQLKAAGRMLEGILSSVKRKHDPETPENVEDLGAFRERREACGEMVEAMNPWESLTDIAEDPERAPILRRAGYLVAASLDACLEVPVFMEVWNLQEPDEIRLAGQVLDWTEGAYLALSRHPDDAEAAVHEWMLVFTERGVVHRGWTRLTIPQRRLLLRGWAKRVREGLAEAPPSVRGVGGDL
jgi:hypothetical protein